MRARVDSRPKHLGYGDTTLPADRGRIDPNIGKDNARFLGHVANGMPRAELIKRWKAGDYPDLHAGLARHAVGERG